MKNIINFLKNPIFLTFLVITICTGALIGLLVKSPSNTISAPYVEYSWGKTDAKIVVTEYGDLQCEGCLNFFEKVEPGLKEKYKDQIKFVWKHFPGAGHGNAQRAAEAVEAAGAQGKFWEYHDLLFQRQSLESEGWNTAKLTEYAKELGLDTERFKKELTEGKYKQLVKDSLNEALNKGYNATPTIEINGKKLENPTFENIDRELQKILGASTAVPNQLEENKTQVQE